MPIMSTSCVQDLRNALGETLELENPFQLEIYKKSGPSIKKLKQSDTCQGNLIIKGIKTFQKSKQGYKHPHIVIGAGSFALRQCCEFWRQSIDNYVLFERKPGLGGDAWYLLANQTSKLQSEGPHYQLMWFPEEREEWLRHDYGYWPSKNKILAHYNETTKRYGIFPHINLNTEVVDTVFYEDEFDFDGKSYGFKVKKTDGSATGVSTVKGSTLHFFPGCLCVPHRKVWPGEDVFGGQIGYGFSNEFDYRKILDQYVVMIGMGAFAAENCRTVMEFGGQKVFIIARHFNLLLPRCISWYCNQSQDPPPAAFILDSFEPMYSILGWDPWKFFSVTANSERTVATIKQYTRWGIGDATFLAIYWNRAEIVQGTVKRFKERAAVLDNGRIIENLDHVIKVIGFDGDFNVDRINHATSYRGYFPEGDHRRWVQSGGSAIDASRFAATGLSPGAASVSWNSLFLFQHPKIAKALVQDPRMSVGTANVELGSPGYHYAPREEVTIGIMLSSCAQAIQENEMAVGTWKKRSMWFLAPPEKFIEECQYDWYQYCEVCRARGDLRPFPDYPYDAEYLRGLTKKEEEFGAQAAAKYQAYAAAAKDQQMSWLATQELTPGSSLSMEPLKAVLRARQRISSPVTTIEDRSAFAKEGESSLSMLRENCGRGVRNKQMPTETALGPVPPEYW